MRGANPKTDVTGETMDRNRKKTRRECGIPLAMVLLLSALTLPIGTALAQSTSIARIDGESDKSVSLVTVGLTNRPEWSGSEPLAIEDHGTFVQVLLPGTIVPTPGTFLDANSPVITKIAAFQVTDPTSGQATNAAIRLFVNQNAAHVRQALVAELLADRVVVTLDHKKLATVTESSKKAALIAARASANNQSSSVEGEMTTDVNQLGEISVTKSNEITSPADLALVGLSKLESEAQAAPSENNRKTNSWSSVGVKVPNLAGKLAVVSGFSLFMLILLGIAHKWRQFRSGAQAGSLLRSTNKVKHRVPGSENGDDYARDQIPMGLKTLTTMTVAPRQKLALMQAGTDTLLLSITPGGIQFLTKVGNQPTVDSTLHASLANLLAGHIQTAPLAQISQGSQDGDNNGRPVKSFSDRLEFSDTTDDETDLTKQDDRRSAAKSVGGNHQKSTRQGASTQTERSRVRVAVTDDGIESADDARAKADATQKSGRGAKAAKQNQSSEESKPSDDITRLIREKLRNLPVI